MEQPSGGPKQGASGDQLKEIGDAIIDLLSEKLENPSEAFVLLQQLSIFLWDNYKIDWNEQAGQSMAATRKQRYLGFVSGLVDNMVETGQAFDFTVAPDAG